MMRSLGKLFDETRTALMLGLAAIILVGFFVLAKRETKEALLRVRGASVLGEPAADIIARCEAERSLRCEVGVGQLTVKPQPLLGRGRVLHVEMDGGRVSGKRVRAGYHGDFRPRNAPEDVPPPNIDRSHEWR